MCSAGTEINKDIVQKAQITNINSVVSFHVKFRATEAHLQDYTISSITMAGRAII